MKLEYISVVEAAKLIRKALKKAFKETKFSVRSSKYAGGASIDIRWTDGPTDEQVNAITAVYSGKGFDGMIDLSYYKDQWLLPDGTVKLAKSAGSTSSGGCDPKINVKKPHPQARLVHFGGDYVHTERNTSLALLQECAKEYSQETGWDIPEIKDTSYGAYFVRDFNLRAPGSQEPLADLYSRRLRKYAQQHD